MNEPTFNSYLKEMSGEALAHFYILVSELSHHSNRDYYAVLFMQREIMNAGVDRYGVVGFQEELKAAAESNPR